jgi:hypothetical protein
MIFKRAHFYELNEFPKCNICGNDLIFRKRKKRDNKETYYEIIKCTYCTDLSRREKLVAFLPKDLSEHIISSIRDNFIKNNRNRKEIWINKGFTEEEARQKIHENQKVNQTFKKNLKTKTKQNYIDEGYSEEEIRNIKPFPSMMEYWIKKGFSLEESKLKVSEYQSKMAKKRKYSDDRYPNQIKYWIKKGFTDENARIKVSEFQNRFSLKICKEKYGEEKGEEIFCKRQEKWLKSYKKSNFSSVSQELFWEIYDNLENKGELEIYFATLKNGKKINDNTNNEYILPIGNSFIKPDFFVKNKNKIIEFDGTYYHRKIPENAKRDLVRDKKIIKNGYSVFHINEYDYHKYKKDVIQLCIDFIND